MLIGEKSNLQKEIQEDFRDSSLSHVLAISGMHVSYVILGITFVISKVKFSKKNVENSNNFNSIIFHYSYRKNSFCNKSMLYEFVYYFGKFTS